MNILNMLKTKRNNTIFIRFVLSYVFILIIPLLITSVVYNKVVQIVKEDQLRNTFVMLERNNSTIGNYFKKIDERVLQLSFEPQINLMMNLDASAEDSSYIYDVWNVSKNLKYYTSQVLFNDKYHMLFKKNQYVMSYNRVNLGFSFFYENYMKYSNLNYTKWYETFINNYHQKDILPSQIIQIDRVRKSYITYAQTLPMGNPNDMKGVIIVLIEEKAIQEILSDIIGNKSGLVYILDKNNNVITSVSKGKYKAKEFNSFIHGENGSQVQKINGEEMLVSYTSSDDRRLKFVAVIPYSVVMEKVGYIHRLSLIIFILSLTAGIGIALFLTYRNLKPLRNIVSVLIDSFKGDVDQNEGEYNVLSKGVNKLINSNKEQRDILDSQSIILRVNFLDRLLKGNFNNENELREHLKYVGMEFKNNYFAVIIISLNSFEDLVNNTILIQQDLLRSQIDNIMWRISPNQFQIHGGNTNEIFIIISFENNNLEECNNYINLIVNRTSTEIKERYDLELFFGIGSFKERLFDVSLSNWEAEFALKYAKLTSTEINTFWYSKIKKERDVFYYPIGLEQQLINLIKSANQYEVERILITLYEKNYEQTAISFATEKLLLFNMLGTLMKIVGEVEIEYNSQLIYNELLQSGKLGRNKTFNTLKEAFIEISELIGKSKKSHNSKLKNDIIDYVIMHYTDPEISVNGISSMFNLSESYFSQFFKEQSGKTFSSYLEDLRIKKSCELLKSGYDNIEEIAVTVGYYSSHSFRRAFKRSLGISPSEYKTK